MKIAKYVTHGRRVQTLARRHGWLTGARYTNLRDVRGLGQLGFLDIDWHKYDFRRHLEVAQETSPKLTIAKDVDDLSCLTQTLDEAYALKEYCEVVAIVPKDPLMEHGLEDIVPSDFIFAYSVPTRYGGTAISPVLFKREVHLLVVSRIFRFLGLVSDPVRRLPFASAGPYRGIAARPTGFRRCVSTSPRRG